MFFFRRTPFEITHALKQSNQRNINISYLYVIESADRTRLRQKVPRIESNLPVKKEKMDIRI